MPVNSRRKLNFLIILLFIVLNPLLAQESVPVFDSEGAGTGEAVPKILLLPMNQNEVPGYVAMIVDRLFHEKASKGDSYSIIPVEELEKVLETEDFLEADISDESTAVKLAEVLGADQILVGEVSGEGSGYKIDSRIVDTASGAILSEETASAADLRGIETAVDNITKNFVKKLLPAEAGEKVVKTLESEAEEKKAAETQESISAFEKIAEENPEEALKLVDEPVRQALKETVREEVVGEEIQNLYEKEKAEAEYRKKLKWQFWTMTGLEGAIQLGNITGTIGLSSRLDALIFWQNYMNDTYPDDNTYYDYQDTYKFSQGMQWTNYIFTGGSNLAMAYAYRNFLGDVIKLSDTGRFVFMLSNMAQISGYLSFSASSQLGFYSQHKYLDYMTATSDFTELYEDYRDSHVFPVIATYASYGLWTLGFSGIVTSVLLPGKKEPLVLSDKNRKYLSWGQALVGFGNLATGMAANYRGRSEDSWIKDNSPSGSGGESDYEHYLTMSRIFYYSSYALFVSGAVLTYFGIMPSGDGSESADTDSDMDKLSFGIVPEYNGLSAVVRLRLE